MFKTEARFKQLKFNLCLFQIRMESPIVITGRKRDAIWLEFERSENGKRAKCKRCPLMKHATASQ